MLSDRCSTMSLNDVSAFKSGRKSTLFGFRRNACTISFAWKDQNMSIRRRMFSHFQIPACQRDESDLFILRTKVENITVRLTRSHLDANIHLDLSNTSSVSLCLISIWGKCFQASFDERVSLPRPSSSGFPRCALLIKPSSSFFNSFALELTRRSFCRKSNFWCYPWVAHKIVSVYRIVGKLTSLRYY